MNESSTFNEQSRSRSGTRSGSILQVQYDRHQEAVAYPSVLYKHEGIINLHLQAVRHAQGHSSQGNFQCLTDRFCRVIKHSRVRLHRTQLSAINSQCY